MIHIVGSTRNGVTVRVDLIHSKAAADISRKPHLLGLAAEALAQITLQESEHTIECDMGRTVGYDSIVRTNTTEAVFYAKLVKDNTYTRFIKHVQPAASSFITMHLQIDKDDGYLLRDVRIGHRVPPRPGSADETKYSKSFWEEHAHIFDGQPIQASTQTKILETSK